MSLDEALAEDILAVLPFGGPFRSVTEVVTAVAPQREAEVRKVMNALAKKGIVDLTPGGGGWQAVYGRHPLKRPA